MSDEPLRLYAIVSEEALKAMKGSRGKLGVQFGHAYLHAFWDAEITHPEAAYMYARSSRAYKTALVVPSTDDLRAIFEAHDGVCGRTLVEDAGFTVFDGPTVTMVGLGPIRRSALKAGVSELRPLQ